MGKREQFDIPDIFLCITGEGIISNKEMLQIFYKDIFLHELYNYKKYIYTSTYVYMFYNVQIINYLGQ